MERIAKLTKSIPALDGLISFGARIGLWGLIWNIVAVVWAIVVTVWAGIWSHVPGWGLAMIFTNVLAAAGWMAAKGMAAYRDFNEARVLSEFDASDLKTFGQEMIGLSNRMLEWLAVRESSSATLARAHASQDRHQQWEYERDLRSETGNLFNKEFNADLVPKLGIVSNLGIVIPHHFLANMSYGAVGCARYLALIGGMLSKGLLQEAITASKDENLMWQVCH